MIGSAASQQLALMNDLTDQAASHRHTKFTAITTSIGQSIFSGFAVVYLGACWVLVYLFTKVMPILAIHNLGFMTFCIDTTD